MEMDWQIFMTGTSETWRKGRKILDRGLQPGAMVSYRQTMHEKTREFLTQLRANPKDFRAHIELSVGHLLYIV
jgi:cytochrome P450